MQQRVLKLGRKPCGFRGCAEKGNYTPVLVFPMLRVKEKPLEMELEVEVCERHRRNPKAAFISDEGFRYMLKLLVKHGFSEMVHKSDIELWFVTEEGLRLPWSVNPSEVTAS